MRLLVVAGIGLALLAGSARAAEPPVLGFSISSGAQTGLQHVSLPSASAPNAPGSISVPVSSTSPPANPQRLPLSTLHGIWQQAGAAYAIPWQVLASINKIESNFGRNMGPSSAGAIGWMQFMPSTWLRWGLDANGDGIADPWNPDDAIYSAARYLAASGGASDVPKSIYSYNHAQWYVNEVLQLASSFDHGGVGAMVGIDRLQISLTEARHQVVVANRVLVPALEAEQALARREARLLARERAAVLLSDRLAAEKVAVQAGYRRDAAAARVAGLRATLTKAEAALQQATLQAQTASLAPATGGLFGAPSYQGSYVFPVGGGPGIVSVG